MVHVMVLVLVFFWILSFTSCCHITMNVHCTICNLFYLTVTTDRVVLVSVSRSAEYRRSDALWVRALFHDGSREFNTTTHNDVPSQHTFSETQVCCPDIFSLFFSFYIFGKIQRLHLWSYVLTHLPAEFLQWYNPPASFGNLHDHFVVYQAESLKSVSQQYRALCDCTDFSFYFNNY